MIYDQAGVVPPPTNTLRPIEAFSPQPRSPKFRLGALDVGIMALLIISAALYAAWGADHLGSTLETARSFNLWFQADSPRVIANLTDASSNHYRVAVHPIAPMLVTSLVLGLHQIGMDLGFAAHFLMFAMAGASVGVFYIFLRTIDLTTIPSLAFTLLFATSAAFVHWAPVEELNVPSMLTIALALALLGYGRTRNRLWWVLVSIVTLGVTITNWSFGLIATAVRWPRRQLIIISAVALCAVSILATVQWMLFSSARPFYLGGAGHEAAWTQPMMERRGSGSWSPIASMRSMLVSTVVAPAPYVEVQEGDKVVTNQKSGIFDRSIVGVAAAAFWVVLLGIGTWGGVRARSLRPVTVALALMALSQAALHSVYGDPTFLYSPHFLPILIAISALSWFTPIRWFAVSLAFVIALLGGVNNLSQFQTATELAKQVMAEGGNNIKSWFPPKGAVLP
jgi:hypothetical protein